MPTVKKAQKGIKATADSSLFYNSQQQNEFRKQSDIVRKSKGTGKSLDDSYKSKPFVESVKRQETARDNQIRQKFEGKPGYDANGFPKKKDGGAVAKDGKWMQKVSASIKRRGTEGKCTPITKPGCTGKAKALAKTFKRISAKRKGK